MLLLYLLTALLCPTLLYFAHHCISYTISFSNIIFSHTLLYLLHSCYLHIVVSSTQFYHLHCCICLTVVIVTMCCICFTVVSVTMCCICCIMSVDSCISQQLISGLYLQGQVSTDQGYHATGLGAQNILSKSTNF